MTDPSRLSISVTHADGSQTRWAPDEQLAENIPTGLSFTTVMPGGFKDCSFSLPRLLTREYLDEALFDTVTVYGPGNTVAWQGRVQQLPREQGGRAAVQVGAVGLSASLKDAPLLTEIYVDSSPQSWGDVSLARKASGMSGNQWSYDAVPVSVGLGADGGIIWTVPANTSIGLSERTEIYYQAPAGCKIAAFQYQGTRTGTWTNWEAATLYVSSSTTSLAGSSNSALTLDDVVNSVSVGTPARYAFLRTNCTTAYTTPTTAGNTSLSQAYRKVAVYGNHGLTLRGSTSSTQGVYASDVITDVLARCAPSLPIDTIADTTFVIPHLRFDSATAEDALLEVNKYHLYGWGVYEDGFFFGPNNEDDSTVYEARLSEGAQMSLEGDDAVDTYNGVIVNYTDTDGTARIAAPTGVTYADYTDDALLSSDPNNPATLHGLTRYGVLQISSPLPNTNADGDNPAIQIGRMWLAEASLPQRRGSITLPALVRHPTEGLVPSWRVRAGDWIRIADRPSDVARRIVQTTYSYDSQTLTAEVGGLPRKVEALLEAVGVQMIGTA